MEQIQSCPVSLMGAGPLPVDAGSIPAAADDRVIDQGLAVAGLLCAPVRVLAAVVTGLMFVCWRVMRVIAAREQ